MPLPYFFIVHVCTSVLHHACQRTTSVGLCVPPNLMESPFDGVSSAHTQPALTRPWALCVCLCRSARIADELLHSAFQESWEQNLGCHLCMVSALSIELSPQTLMATLQDPNTVNSQNPEEPLHFLRRFALRQVFESKKLLLREVRSWKEMKH